MNETLKTYNVRVDGSYSDYMYVRNVSNVSNHNKKEEDSAYLIEDRNREGLMYIRNKSHI